jgi:TRAP-type mannitol/chloroaromatic compound transport system permease large subunit
MYKGAIVPGLILTGLYMLYVFAMTLIFPKAAPALPAEARSFGEGAAYAPVIRAAVFPLVLIVGGMVALFNTPAGIGLVKDFAPWVAAQFITPIGNEGGQIGAILALLAVLYLIYVAILRYAPGATGVLAALAVLVVGALLARQIGGDLVDGAASLPPFSDGIAGWVLAVIAWLAGEWASAAAIVGLLGAAAAFLTAPSRPVSAAVWKIVADLLPPLVLIFLVLGTIFQGIATPTEGGAMGALGALILAFAKGRLKFDVIRQGLDSTVKLSAFVLFILIGSRIFSLTFYGVDGHKWVEDLLVGLPGGQIGFLIVVNALVFVLAFFLDFFELAFIIVPLLAGPADRLGIDLIWFGVILAVNMQTSFMHPPFGFALFYLRSVAARVPYLDRISRQSIAPVTTAQIYWGAVPFVLIQVIMIGITIAFPKIVTHYQTANLTNPADVRIEAPTSAPSTAGPNFGGPNFNTPPPK